MRKETPWALIAKYLSGECNAWEQFELEDWLKEPDNDRLFCEIQEAWNTEKEEASKSRFHVESGVNKLRGKLNPQQQDEDAKSITAHSIGNNPRNPFKKWLIAASLTGLLLIGFFFIYQLPLIAPQQEIAYIERVSKEGQRVKIQLPDGSEVWLNQNSSLSYPEKFSDSTRTVSLEGEAFFQVRPNKEKPFVVMSQGISTKVLGTSFNISAYAKDPVTKVAVATGKVAVRKEGNKFNQQIAQLIPSQQLVLNKQDGSSFIDTVSILGVASWRSDLLVFRNSTYQEVLERLEKIHQVTINVENKNLLNCGVMISLSQGTGLEESLELLSLAGSFEYKIDHNTHQVTITGGECQ